MAVATLWLVVSGGEVDALAHEPEPLSGDAHTPNRSSFPTRQLSCFLVGFLTILADLLNGLPLSFGRLFPLPFSPPTAFAFFNSA